MRLLGGGMRMSQIQARRQRVAGPAPSQESVFVSPHFKPQVVYGQLPFFLASFLKQREPHPTRASRNRVAVSHLSWSTLAHHQELCLWQLLLLLGPEATSPLTLHFWAACGAQRYPSPVGVHLWSFAYLFKNFICYGYRFGREGVGHSMNSLGHLGWKLKTELCGCHTYREIPCFLLLNVKENVSFYRNSVGFF